MDKQDQERLDNYILDVKNRVKNFLGYPVATDFDYSKLFELLNYPLNNLGDPLVESTYDLNSRSIEREVVDFFADLFNAPKDNRWGYVTNGGSEGNLYALYLARELYPDGMVYYSEDTHYCIQKNISLLNMPSILIKSQENGEIDYDDFEKTINTHRDRPAIIVANIGTTMKEAKDDVVRIKQILKNSAIRNHYIHSDAALSGTYMAALDLEPKFDFLNGADSVAISGHKFIGSPIPCGVVIVKKNYKDRIGQAVPYIGTLDTTITGSRNGHSPLFLWYAIKNLGIESIKQRAKNSMKLANYLLEELLKLNINAFKNDNAITVVFAKPKEEICVKWQLASEEDLSHIICMPGVTKDMIDEFINDLK